MFNDEITNKYVKCIITREFSTLTDDERYELRSYLETRIKNLRISVENECHNPTQMKLALELTGAKECLLRLDELSKINSFLNEDVLINKYFGLNGKLHVNGISHKVENGMMKDGLRFVDSFIKELVEYNSCKISDFEIDHVLTDGQCFTFNHQCIAFEKL